MREERHVMGVDLGELGQLLRIVGVVRHRMVQLGHADVRVGPRARLARQLERDHSCHVGLQREHLELEHELHVVFPHGRHVCRAVEIDRDSIGAGLLGALIRRSTSRTRSKC